MLPMLCVSSMEGRCAVAGCEWNCPTGKSAVAPAGRPLRGVDGRESATIIGDVVHRPGEDLHAGGASAAVEAGLFLGTGGGRGPSPGTGTTSPQDPSHVQGVAPGHQKGSEMFSEARKRSREVSPFHAMDKIRTVWSTFLCWIFNRTFYSPYSCSVDFTYIERVCQRVTLPFCSPKLYHPAFHAPVIFSALFFVLFMNVQCSLKKNIDGTFSPFSIVSC